EELLAAERDTVRGLAHRLRTPVTALRLEAENVTDPEVRADLAELVGQLQVAIDDAVREARRGLREDLRAGCDAVAVVGARVDYWTPLAEDQGRSTTVTMPKAPLRVGLSALELGDVVDVCIDNIFAHTPEGTAFEVRLVAEPDRAELSISDHGPGFPQERQARPGSSGEGLHIVRRLAQRVGGSVRTSPVGRPGAEVTVRLPLVDRS
ncbi:MAG: HAMP domain-containing sensor histidine kinase, partial [Propionicimonas sp.]